MSTTRLELTYAERQALRRVIKAALEETRYPLSGVARHCRKA
jgi:hypothetical protein